MKKNILKLVFASAFALVAGYSVYASQKKVEMSDLAMANVEALASGEGSSQDCEIYCYYCPGWDCIISWGPGIDGVTCQNHRKR